MSEGVVLVATVIPGRMEDRSWDLSLVVVS